MELYRVDFSGERSLSGVFEASDRLKAAELALTSAVKDHGFFAVNRIHTQFPISFVTPPDALGFLVMPKDVVEMKLGGDEELAHLAHSDSTTWIHVSLLVLNELRKD